jgi:hypothetical protein
VPAKSTHLKSRNVIQMSMGLREARLRRAIRAHFKVLGFLKGTDGSLVPPSLDKIGYRELHAIQRSDNLDAEERFLEEKATPLVQHFAQGSEVDVDKIAIRLEPIFQSTWQSDLFRLASLLWSVPVSKGFGRRLRFLVWDDHAGKLAGLLALGDPVFNLRARDAHIGWSATDRQTRLVSLLDGYVVGAVPPYNLILGGKLVACLMRTRDIVEQFRVRYARTEGIISGEEKNAHLVAVTTTSALGRSSIYNRLKLDGQPYLSSIGYTTGYGHFHFPHSLFEDMRSYLRHRKEPYAGNHKYGNGPNWKFRAIRRTLQLLDMDPDLVKHGLTREVFLCGLADNALDILSGKRKRPKYSSLRSVDEVAELALARWVRPRAARDRSYEQFRRRDIMNKLGLLTESKSREIKDGKRGQRA